MDDEDRYTRITLRIPKDLHRRLSDAADQTSKSLNAEIVARLSGSFQSAVVDHIGLEKALDIEKRLSKTMAAFAVTAIDFSKSDEEPVVSLLRSMRPMAKAVLDSDDVALKVNAENFMIYLIRHFRPGGGKTWEKFIDETLEGAGLPKPDWSKSERAD